MTSTVTDPDMPQWAVKAPDYSAPAIENSKHSMEVNSFSKRLPMILIYESVFYFHCSCCLAGYDAVRGHKSLFPSFQNLKQNGKFDGKKSLWVILHVAKRNIFQLLIQHMIIIGRCQTDSS